MGLIPKQEWLEGPGNAIQWASSLVQMDWGEGAEKMMVCGFLHSAMLAWSYSNFHSASALMLKIINSKQDPNIVEFLIKIHLSIMRKVLKRWKKKVHLSYSWNCTASRMVYVYSLHSTLHFSHLPPPLYLTHWSSVLYIFFKDGCLVSVVFISVVGKTVRKLKYLKKFQGKKKFFVIILIYYCVPIVNMKHSYFAIQGLTLYCCYI